MPKASVTDLQAEGFNAKNFALTAGPAWDAYLQSVVEEAGAWASYKVGADLYAGAVNPAYPFFALRRAELCFASMLLWRRRVGFLDGNATTDHGEGAPADRREMLAHMQSAMDCANSNLLEAMQALGVDPAANGDGLGTCVGFIETGRFPLSSTGALNA